MRRVRPIVATLLALGLAVSATGTVMAKERGCDGVIALAPATDSL